MKIDVIAEIGWNHMGDMDLAVKMINLAKKSGCDYAKFQTWKVDRLKAGPWDKDGRRQIYEQAELAEEDHYYLKTACDKDSIKFLTSCFSSDDLPFIRKLSNEVKIPSTECRNRKLVKSAVQNFDRVFVSVGASTRKEWGYLEEYPEVVLMHCVSVYPCPEDSVNLPKLRHMVNNFGSNPIGYSGHYTGPEDAIAAIGIGATVIEKDFTLDRSLPGRDNKFAIFPADFRRITKFARKFEKMSKFLGLDYQKPEQDARDTYAGRWD